MREYPLETGYADYLLFVDRKAVGIVEAKKEGIPLAGVAEQMEELEAALEQFAGIVEELGGEGE